MPSITIKRAMITVIEVIAHLSNLYHGLSSYPLVEGCCLVMNVFFGVKCCRFCCGFKNICEVVLFSWLNSGGYKLEGVIFRRMVSYFLCRGHLTGD